MTFLQKPAETQHATGVSTHSNIAAASSDRRHLHGSIKHHVRGVIHDLAKLCVPSAVGRGRRARWGAQVPWQLQIPSDEHERDQIHASENHKHNKQSTSITQRQLITEPKPRVVQNFWPRPLNSNTEQHGLQQPQQQKHHITSRKPPLTELVSGPGATSKVYIINTPRRRPVALKLSTDASSIERQYCVQTTARDVFRDLQELLKQVGVGVILPNIPACVKLYPNLSSYSEGCFSINSSGTQSLPLPVFHSSNLPDDKAKHAAAFSMEYIYPFHENHTKYLIHRYLAGCVQTDALTLASKGSSQLLGRLCMGSHTPMSDPSNPEMHNRPIYIDQLIAEGVNALELAASMGATLATFHWSCGLDTLGVQFIMGCDVKGQIRIWATSFARCNAFCRTEKAVKTQLVRAVAHSPTIWPPRKRGVGCVEGGDGKDMWDHFRFVYLEFSSFLLDSVPKNVKKMPKLFFKELEAVYERRGILRA